MLTAEEQRLRNENICRRYRAGDPPAAIARDVGLSPGRVIQIVRAAGISRHDRPKPYNGRDEFLGIELEELTKVALRQEAAKRGLSMSKLSADTLREMLIACGYPLEADKIRA